MEWEDLERDDRLTYVVQQGRCADTHQQPAIARQRAGKVHRQDRNPHRVAKREGVVLLLPSQAQHRAIVAIQALHHLLGVLVDVVKLDASARTNGDGRVL